MQTRVSVGDRLVIEPAAVGALIAALRSDGFRVVGPMLRDGAIVYDELSGLADLPAGWTDEQAPGHYRVKPRGDEALFGYAVGPHSWKQFLFPATQRLWSGRRTADGFTVTPEEPDGVRFAFIGARGCELAAIAIQDRVFAEGAYPDPHYTARRGAAFIVAVQCAVAADSCFCTSMGTGPGVESGHDLALTELVDDARHVLLVDVGSERGASVISRVPHQPATDADDAEVTSVVERTATNIERRLETRGLREALGSAANHPRWADVAERCLTCGNCTMVCPTCFCHSVEDTSDLTVETVARDRHWDSCFSEQLTYVHGNIVRQTPSARYRQWLTHKLSTWHDQFGTSGCVGCGRCISWCPVGIDITEEAAAIHLGEVSHARA